MRDFDLQLDGPRAGGADEEAVFLRIARQITEDIRRGRLRPGDGLPGSRPLAKDLGVHRNTVIAAYRELQAEGWIETSPARSTRVRAELPEVRPRRFAEVSAGIAERPSFALPLAAPPRRVDSFSDAQPPGASRPGPKTRLLSLQGGVPDLRLVPRAALARAYRRALATRRREPSLLDYGDPRGEERLRAALAAMVARVRGVPATADDVLVTRGSQMGLFLAARAIITPGDAVAVEAFGYRPAWHALELAGARLVPVPVDADGLRVDALEAIVSDERIRAVYVTPHHQYPTTALLSPARRLALLEVARRGGLAIIEDDYDHEFHYEARPVLPLASADRAGSVVYIGTLSKILAPGLRLGFVVAPRAVLERMTALRTIVDRQGDHVLERAVAELLEDGEVQRHARRMRRLYHVRRDTLVDSLRRELDGLAFSVPQGGMALWVHAPGVDVDGWQSRAAERGVLFSTARRFAFDERRRPYLRIGFAAEDDRSLRDAVTILKATVA